MAGNRYQPNRLNVIFQNINGWHNKKEDLKLDYRRHNPDVILLACTNIYNGKKPIYFYPYTVYQQNTEENWSGVAILVKRDIDHHLVNHKFNDDTLAIRVETSLGPIIIGTNYSPPRRRALPKRDLNWFANHSLPTYLLADLNARHTTYDTSSNLYGLALYHWFLIDGSLRRLGPETGTFTSPAGNVSKPDIVLANQHAIN